MSPEQLLKVLDKLLQENLHGPILPIPRNSTVSVTKESIESPVREQDLDTFDPRWKTLFIDNFIENLGESNDDLLFFVLDDLKLAPSDSIIVKRRILNAGLPALSMQVDWKKTFYLNLISQTSCYLTVAICQKQENDTVNSGNFTKDQNSIEQKKQKMIANERIVKKVFSAPYKSRMDVKDALMNECSYPLVYYTVNDFESLGLQLEINQNEYLCVELCILLPQKLGLDSDYTSMTRPQSAGEKSNFNDLDDLSPFPTPPDATKIILFQGAVPYLSLSDVYAQKSLAAQNSLKLSWSKLNSTPDTVKVKKTEYIMMRGPRGKGQCQVAINSLPIEEEKKNSGILKKLTGVASKILGSDRVKSEESLAPGLVVSITYVNVAWQSIVNDLLQFAKDSKSIKS